MHAGESDEETLLTGYQASRDHLSLPLFEVTDTIAAYTWNAVQVDGLLKQLSVAMADEVDAILAYDNRATEPGDKRRLPSDPRSADRAPSMTGVGNADR